MLFVVPHEVKDGGVGLVELLQGFELATRRPRIQVSGVKHVDRWIGQRQKPPERFVDFCKKWIENGLTVFGQEKLDDSDSNKLVFKKILVCV